MASGSSPWIEARREDDDTPKAYRPSSGVAVASLRAWTDAMWFHSRQRCRGMSINATLWIAVALLLTWVLGQVLVVQVSMDEIKHRPSAIGSLKRSFTTSGNGSQFADDMAQAYDEWKALQEKYPQKFSNFSQYLMEEKVKESNLRRRLSKLSKRSLDIVSQIVVPPAQAPPPYSKEEDYELKWSYLSEEKAWPYVGSDRYMDQFRLNSRHYFNSLAVFPHANRTRLHGLVGIWPNGTRAWQPDPMPPPINEFPGGKDKALLNGGFYLNLSNALPLDRDGPDGREEFCHKETYDLASYDDASVIITYYNEPASTLLRSVHSVLNRTPPPLLREIILVDDHSNNTDNLPGGYLYQYVKLLPKVKLMRLPERRGLVQARLAGAKLAKAPVIVVLDSHIEVNIHWLEPQLKRLAESPKSVVFPQIMSLDSEDLRWRQDAGIGCFLSFKWMMQERPYFTKMTSADPVSSASMAGGLFAVRRDWFFDAGGYDEEFSMWGAENVEMAFRFWMCGGRVECTPCARTYHIYRHGGSGYKSPGEYIKKNRLRTGRIWLDEWWQVAQHFNDYPDFDMGSLDKMLELKERLQCKSFDWFLKNVDPSREGTDLDSFGAIGELRSLAGDGKHCLDEMSKRNAGEPVELYACHGQGAAQGWFEMKDSHRLHNMSHENLCVANHLNMTYCDQPGRDDQWKVMPERKWIAFKTNPEASFDSENYEADWQCLGVNASVAPWKLKMDKCVVGDATIEWAFKTFQRDPNFQLPTISPERREIIARRRQQSVGAV